MSNSYMKSPGAGVHPLFPITPGKDKGMTPMLEDLGTERRSTRKLFPQRSPLKSAWKELRAKAQSRRNIRVLLILAILATFYGIFELNFQTFSVWYKIADRFPGDKVVGIFLSVLTSNKGTCIMLRKNCGFQGPPWQNLTIPKSRSNRKV